MIFVEVVKNDMCQPMIGLHRLYMGPPLVLGESNRLTTWHVQVVAKCVLRLFGKIQVWGSLK